MPTYKVTWENVDTIKGYIEAADEQDLINKLHNTTRVNEAGDTVPGSAGFDANYEMSESTRASSLKSVIEVSTGTEKTSGFPDPQ